MYNRQSDRKRVLRYSDIEREIGYSVAESIEIRYRYMLQRMDKKTCSDREEKFCRIQYGREGEIRYCTLYTVQ